MRASSVNRGGMWGYLLLLLGILTADTAATQTIGIDSVVIATTKPFEFLAYQVEVPEDIMADGFHIHMYHRKPNITSTISFVLAGGIHPKEIQVPYRIQNSGNLEFSRVETVLPLDPSYIQKGRYAVSVYSEQAIPFRVYFSRAYLRAQEGKVKEIQVTSTRPEYLFWDFVEQSPMVSVPRSNEDRSNMTAVYDYEVEIRALGPTDSTCIVKVQLDDDNLLGWSRDADVYLSAHAAMQTFRKQAFLLLRTPPIRPGVHRWFLKVALEKHAEEGRPDELVSYQVMIRKVEPRDYTLPVVLPFFGLCVLMSIVMAVLVNRFNNDVVEHESLAEEDSSPFYDNHRVRLSGKEDGLDSPFDVIASATRVSLTMGEFMKHNLLVFTVFALFYIIPSYQFVGTMLNLFNLGLQDVCYYNFRCMRGLHMFATFNNLYSNIGYIIVGICFSSYVAYRFNVAVQAEKEFRAACAANPSTHFTQKGFASMVHYILLCTAGISTVCVGIMSAMYHICPTTQNFQFDTSFMFLTSTLFLLSLITRRNGSKFLVRILLTPCC